MREIQALLNTKWRKGKAERSSEITKVDTPRKYKYKYLQKITDVTSVVVKVKAGCDAHIGLAAGEKHKSEKYEIIIGGSGNQKSAIRHRPQYTKNVIKDRASLKVVYHYYKGRVMKYKNLNGDIVLDTKSKLREITKGKSNQKYTLYRVVADHGAILTETTDLKSENKIETSLKKGTIVKTVNVAGRLRLTEPVVGFTTIEPNGIAPNGKKLLELATDLESWLYE